MKTLYLLRHAKSSWSEHGLADRDRPLAKRGLGDAPRMGERFAGRGEGVDRAVSSPALRARHTAELFCGAAAVPADALSIDDRLYFLGPGSVEDVIRDQPDAAASLMLVFHNPDITAFANRADAALDIDNVPTCGLLRFACAIERWRDWSTATSEFRYFDYPKNPAGEPLTG